MTITFGDPPHSRQKGLMNVSIRLATNADSTRIAAIYAPYVVNTAVSFENEPPGPEEMEQRVHNTLDPAVARLLIPASGLSATTRDVRNG